MSGEFAQPAWRACSRKSSDSAAGSQSVGCQHCLTGLSSCKSCADGQAGVSAATAHASSRVAQRALWRVRFRVAEPSGAVRS